MTDLLGLPWRFIAWLISPKCEACGEKIVGRRSWSRQCVYHPECVDVSDSYGGLEK
ncbi:hypothetical protein ACFQMA_23150 [Halosimplex aquaticum]|uniref:FPG and IleRS Zinc finger-containing protein n=1 Tax=Halosimplex aquaticum TaxID=3026162 RepID=A0ABD5YEF2_9EURY|nr:hypothetical protein [Halosimplex aquaticum]